MAAKKKAKKAEKVVVEKDVVREPTHRLRAVFPYNGYSRNEQFDGDLETYKDAIKGGIIQVLFDLKDLEEPEAEAEVDTDGEDETKPAGSKGDKVQSPTSDEGTPSSGASVNEGNKGS